MTFPVVGSNIPSVYQISNSLRFNDGDNPNLNRTFSSSGSRTTWTFSTWVKKCEIADTQFLFGVNSTSNPENNGIYFRGDDAIEIDSNDGGNRYYVITSAKYRDVSAWYHIVCHWNTTDATASNRFKVYVNGEEQTIGGSNYPPQNYEGQINRNVIHRVGGAYNYTGTYVLDGYLAETHFIDGQALAPSNFAEADEDSGIWKPKQYAGTYGTNGFYLKFNNTGNMGEDSSGNDNTFTPTNLSGTTDVTTDTPTNNFATLNPLILGGSITTSEGNTKISKSTTAFKTFYGTVPIPTSGKFYWEVVETSSTSGDVNIGICVLDGTLSTNVDTYPTNNLTSYVYYSGDGNKNTGPGNSSSSYGATYGQNDIISVLFDADAGTLTFYKNGVSQGTAFTGLTEQYIPVFGLYDSGTTISVNFGNPSFSISSGNSDDNGYGNFEYAPPSGYLALCTQNLATALSPTIDDGSQYFNTVLYTGTGSSQSITGVGFQPDFTWIKIRNTADAHGLVDSTRGATKHLRSDSTASEFTRATDVSSFDSDGFTVVSDAQFNGSGNTYVGWNWKANAGSTSSNTDGSITSTVQANTTAGFSIVTWTGNATASATVGHGLGVAPKVVIIKNRSDNESWWVGHQGAGSIGDGKYLFLNSTNAVATNNTSFCNANPTTTTIKVGGSTSADNLINGSGDNMLAYCFAEIEGYSKFGSYTGNGSSDGTFVYTGFRPAWVMIRRYNNGGNWKILDNKRANTYNVIEYRLEADLSDAEKSTSSHYTDFVSNGFKLRGSALEMNGSGYGYIYMAFAENPFVTSGATPVTAR